MCVSDTLVNSQLDSVQVVVSVAEHHANIVPWQIVCKAKGATLKHIGLTATQELDIDDLRSKVCTDSRSAKNYSAPESKPPVSSLRRTSGVQQSVSTWNRSKMLVAFGCAGHRQDQAHSSTARFKHAGMCATSCTGCGGGAAAWGEGPIGCMPVRAPHAC